MQQLNPSEISDLIKQRIDQLEVASQATNEGTIVSVTDGIIRIHGLTEVQYGEMIEFDGGVYGLALEPRARLGGRGRVWATTSSWPKARPVAALAAFSKVPVGPALQGPRCGLSR
jgi:F-type H+-transporting ATPase subunit alpha